MSNRAGTSFQSNGLSNMRPPRAAAVRLGSVLLWLCLSCQGCAPLLVGTAISGGAAASYLHGEVVETYDVDYARAVSDSRETLESLKIPVASTVGDEIKTLITAKRPDQTPVTVKVLKLSPSRVQVGIRTGPVGITELDTSRSIQAQLKNRFARTTPPETPAAADRPRSPQAGPSIHEPPKPKPAKDIRKPSRPIELPPAPRVVIYFDHDLNDADVIEGERPLLDSIIASLMARPTTTIAVHGYANLNGSIEHNRTVSASCANAVKGYMVNQGADAGRIRVLGNGTKGFAATERPQIKRRVEIVFDPPR
jgi:outer membrane protein OmpA-like peptidoglycan-associated protein